MSARQSALRDAIKSDEKKAAAKRDGGYMPFRFWQNKGEQCEVIILDSSMDEAFWRHEHNLKIGGKWGNYEPCIAESGPCPFCEMDSRPSLVIFLSVLVLRPYKNKKTGKVTQYSKMLLALKRQQFAEFDRIEAIAMKKHGTLRGVSLLLHREDEENSFSTGMPIANEDGMLINDFLSEKQLAKEFGHDAIMRDGKTLKRADEDIEPFDYKKLFPKPDEDAIREEHGMTVLGSRKANSEEAMVTKSKRSRADDDDDDDEIPGVSSKRSRPVDDDEEEEEEEEAVGTDWTAIGTVADEEDGEEEEVDEAIDALSNAAKERGLDPDDFPTWSELASAIQDADASSEEDAEDEDEEDEEEEEPPKKAVASRRGVATKKVAETVVRSRRRSEPTFED